MNYPKAINYEWAEITIRYPLEKRWAEYGYSTNPQVDYILQALTDKGVSWTTKKYYSYNFPKLEEFLANRKLLYYPVYRYGANGLFAVCVGITFRQLVDDWGEDLRKDILMLYIGEVLRIDETEFKVRRPRRTPTEVDFFPKFLSINKAVDAAIYAMMIFSKLKNNI